ncbi:U-scoloptoxin(05)-Cw1a-like [Mya arenaria]|uniref:U-scoloptoxin(05)-Cw1a-like n=1 Tax=Mya arenaria TaxID=6604 RepID=UPI0022E2D0CC|nr:U-scoloptoxin(05)-Cw1a-like [Mya arenaria]
MDQFLLFCTILFGTFQLADAEPFACYSCTYTLSSDPRVDYECVNATQWPHTLKCERPRSCYTKALFNQDMSHVRSVLRTCQAPALCSGDNCCVKDGPYPTCEHKCTTDRCNSINVESWFDSGLSSAPAVLYDSMNYMYINVLLLVLMKRF